MTDWTDALRDVARSRRSLLRTGGAVSGGLVLGLGGRGTAGAQPAETQVEIPAGKALMLSDEYRPGARFRVVSGVIEERPTVEAVQNQDVWSETNTRIIEYLNTGERVSLFPIAQADIQAGDVYEFSSGTLALFDREAGIVSVEYGYPDPARDDGAGDPATAVAGNGGQVLVAPNNYYPGSRLEVVSGVVDWRPRENVRESDFFTDYDTRYGEYQNTSDEFLFYPAESADLTEGAVYRMEDEFDLTDPAGELLTAKVVLVNAGGGDGQR